MLILDIQVVSFLLLHSHVLSIISDKNCPCYLLLFTMETTFRNIVSHSSVWIWFWCFFPFFSLAVLIVVKYRTWFDDTSSLNKIWDNNNKRLLHNLNENHVYNFQSFFFKKLRGKYHLKLEHWECPVISLPSNKMLLLIIMFEAKITSLDFAIFQGSNLKLDTCQFTVVYIVKYW